MKDAPRASASFESLGGERSRVSGALGFTTVTPLLPVGSRGDRAGPRRRSSIFPPSRAATAPGLALLIEWLSVARGAGRSLRYENMPAQLHQLARLSDVDALLSGIPAQ